MESKTLEQQCDELMESINNVNASPAEAEALANKFLSMTYRINNKIRDVKNELIALTLYEKSAYSKAFESIDGKANVSKAKAVASADKDYMLTFGKLTKKENERDYWKGVYEVFTNAHIFYKLLTRD